MVFQTHIKTLRKAVFYSLVILGVLYILLNAIASKRVSKALVLLENPKNPVWKGVVSGVGDEKLVKHLLECCVSLEIKKEIIKTQLLEQKRAEKLKRGIVLNPYAWPLMLELAEIYNKRGRINVSQFYFKKALKVNPILKSVTSY